MYVKELHFPFFNKLNLIKIMELKINLKNINTQCIWGPRGVTYFGQWNVTSRTLLRDLFHPSQSLTASVHTKLLLLPPASRNGRPAAVINSKKQAALRRTNVARLQIARNALQKNADCSQRAAEGEADWLHQSPDDIPPGEVHPRETFKRVGRGCAGALAQGAQGVVTLFQLKQKGTLFQISI